MVLYNNLQTFNYLIKNHQQLCFFTVKILRHFLMVDTIKTKFKVVA